MASLWFLWLEGRERVLGAHLLLRLELYRVVYLVTSYLMTSRSFLVFLNIVFCIYLLYLMKFSQKLPYNNTFCENYLIKKIL